MTQPRENLDLEDPASVFRFVGDFVRRNASLSAADSLALGALVAHCQQTMTIRDALGAMLDRLAVIVKGEPEPDSEWGFDDLPELVQALVDSKKAVH